MTFEPITVGNPSMCSRQKNAQWGFFWAGVENCKPIFKIVAASGLVVCSTGPFHDILTLFFIYLFISAPRGMSRQPIELRRG